MDTQKVQALIAVIDKSLLAFKEITTELQMRKSMLPTLAEQIRDNERKSGDALQAIRQLKRELGLTE